MRRILVAVGTRPEAIKMAPVVKTLASDPRCRVRLCITGQHRQMLDQALAAFELRADVDLNLMRPDQNLASLTASVLEGMMPVLAREEPDLVMVQGDTTTTFAVALASFYARIPVAHVEAGLRTGDLAAPYPEEANRRLTATLARLHFPPTSRARDCLLREGVPSDHVFVTGNTVIDALFATSQRISADPALGAHLAGTFGFLRADARLVLVTGHRRESFGRGFEGLCEGIRAAANRYPETDFVYPVHLNPNVRAPVLRYLGDVPNIRLIEPVDYLGMVWLLLRAHIVATDSGGLQEEAPSLGKPVLVLRDTTERPEGLEANTARLVGTDPSRILEGIQALMDDAGAYEAMRSARNPYGDGQAAERIREILGDWFAEAERRRAPETRCEQGIAAAALSQAT